MLVEDILLISSSEHGLPSQPWLPTNVSELFSKLQGKGFTSFQESVKGDYLIIYIYMSGGQNSYPVSLTVRNLLTVAYETLTLAYSKLLTATR